MKEEKEPSRFVRKNNPAFSLVLALALVLIGASGASLVKTAGGAVTVRELRWQTPSGHTLAGQLFIPDGASQEKPAPAIVCAHGWMLNSEYQDEVYIEMSRRGYVVLSIDMYGHGDSDNLPMDDWWETEGVNGANGMYDAVRMAASLPFVDASRIGVTGNSNGATSCNLAVMLDNRADKPLIASVLLVVNEPITAEGQGLIGVISKESDDRYYNLYGSRDAGLVAVQYDEIFNRLILRDGTVTSPRDFIHQPTAQSFLHFGKDAGGLDERESNTLYTEMIDSKEAIRVIWNPKMIHPWSFFSSRVMAYTIEFFEESLPAPNPLPSSSQVWQWKTLFSAMGLSGIGLFFVSFLLLMLKTRTFAPLAADSPVQLRQADRTGKGWMRRGLIAGALFSMLSYPVVFVAGVLLQPKFFNQQQTWVLGLWSLCNALFTLLVLRRNYKKYAKAAGLDLRAEGVYMERGKAAKTVLLGVLAPAATYVPVFLVRYFFHTDFHVWLLAGINSFPAGRLDEIAKFLPFFFAFYAVNSAAMNVFNRIAVGKREWVNLAVMSLANIAGVILLYLAVYITFAATGTMPTDSLGWGIPSMIFWLISMFVILPAATVASRVIYRATRNIWLPALAISILVTCMLCAKTLTSV